MVAWLSKGTMTMSDTALNTGFSPAAPVTAGQVRTARVALRTVVRRGAKAAAEAWDFVDTYSLIEASAFLAAGGFATLFIVRGFGL